MVTDHAFQDFLKYSEINFFPSALGLFEMGLLKNKAIKQIHFNVNSLLPEIPPPPPEIKLNKVRL